MEADYGSIGNSSVKLAAYKYHIVLKALKFYKEVQYVKYNWHLKQFEWLFLQFKYLRCIRSPCKNTICTVGQNKSRVYGFQYIIRHAFF